MSNVGVTWFYLPRGLIPPWPPSESRPGASLFFVGAERETEKREEIQMRWGVISYGFLLSGAFWGFSARGISVLLPLAEGLTGGLVGR